MVVDIFQDETGKQVVQKVALDKLYEPISAVPREDIGPPIFPVDDTRSTYGLGFYNGQYRGRPSYVYTLRVFEGNLNMQTSGTGCEEMIAAPLT